MCVAYTQLHKAVSLSSVITARYLQSGRRGKAVLVFVLAEKRVYTGSFHPMKLVRFFQPDPVH